MGRNEAVHPNHDFSLELGCPRKSLLFTAANTMYVAPPKTVTQSLFLILQIILDETP